MSLSNQPPNGFYQSLNATIIKILSFSNWEFWLKKPDWGGGVGQKDTLSF